MESPVFKIWEVSAESDSISHIYAPANTSVHEEENTTKRRLKLITADFSDIELSSRKNTFQGNADTFTSDAEYYEIDMLSTPR